ncbi:MAG TPA: septal ring lytic transglycosylase RlpA family protein [Acidimicrobiales bacterium]|nr:septal ring lytic transglycosylase RlpA family protein [Acidimicrobiales bacterium]
MARHRPERRGPAPAGRRRALAALALVLAALVVPTSPAPASTAPGGAAGAGAARSRRAALLLEAADLTDRLESSEAAVVAAQLGRTRAAAGLRAAGARMRERAVAAYMRGPGRYLVAFDAPGPYLEVAATKERATVEGYRQSIAAMSDLRRRAEAAAADARGAEDRLRTVQAQLDAVIAADDARQAEEQRRADEARQAALAAQAQALAAARARTMLGTGPAGVASAGGYDPVPLDANALLPRHWAATNRQLALMRSIPFGPVAGGRLPAGLAPTGQVVAGPASWYGPGFDGRPTASGAIYDQEGWTVASKELPLGTVLLVGSGNRQVLLLVNDRGPYVDGRVLDLSAAAARALGVSGVAPVWAEVVGAYALGA